jgi:3-deoxy-D-manno-octulosonate 8-phosphate phosphatase (KDO 8-P phosphatase)
MSSTAPPAAGCVRLLLLDVDGVMTDGRLLVGSDGGEAAMFHIRDGAAIVWARLAGLKTGIITGRTSAATVARAEALRFDVIRQGALDKLAAYQSILHELGIADEQVAFMGDDLLDLPVLVRVGLSAAPADADAEVRARVHWVSARRGGDGAVRDLVEMVLKAQGHWDRLVAHYTRRGDDTATSPVASRAASTGDGAAPAATTAVPSPERAAPPLASDVAPRVRP